MDYQTKPQFEELPWRECCTADCSRCPTFSSPFRRVGDVAYCRFALLSFRQVGDGLRFNPDRIVRLVFVLSGSLKFERANDPVRLITSKQCACLPCGEPFSLTGQDEGTRAVVLSLSRGLGFCEGDIFGASASEDTVIPADPIPSLSLHPVIESLLAGLFVVPELVECARYHRIKATELFLLIKALYAPTELAYFFQPMMQPEDHFRTFVCNNYERARSVAELAALAGMSLSVFKRRFAEHFDDSVYHWMMRQKAQRILTDIQDGEQSTRALMEKYGFRYYTQFSRFCKNYLQATPAQLIAVSRPR